MKKGKLLLSIMGICMALAVLCFGVYASAIPHRYGLGGNIGYKVTDAYVQITTTTYKYSTSKIDLASTLRTCAKGLETKTITQLNSDVTVDGKTLTRVGRVGGVYDTLQDPHSEYATLDDESITFSTQPGSEVYAYFYVLNVKNLSSSAPVYVKVTDNSQTLWDNYACNMYHYRTEDIVGLTSTDTTNNNIVIGFALIDETSEFEDVDFSYDVEVGIAEKYNPVKADAEREYYYVEMGDWYGVPVRYRLVATNQSANFENGQTSFVYYNSTFNANTLPHDINGVFLQETCTNQIVGTGGANNWTCSYTERDVTAVGGGIQYGKAQSLSTMKFGSSIEYLSSTVRDYLNGIQVDKLAASKNNSDGSVEAHTSFFDDFEFSSSHWVYSHIQGRTVGDIAANTRFGGFGSKLPTSQTINNEDNVYCWSPSDTTASIPDGLSSSTLDKLWIMDQAEVMLFLGGQTDPTIPRYQSLYSKFVWGINDGTSTGYHGSWYWTRTADDNIKAIGDSGRQFGYGQGNNIMAVRPCFQLAL